MYRPASHVAWHDGTICNPMPELTSSPSQGSMNSATGKFNDPNGVVGEDGRYSLNTAIRAWKGFSYLGHNAAVFHAVCRMTFAVCSVSHTAGTAGPPAVCRLHQNLHKTLKYNGCCITRLCAIEERYSQSPSVLHIMLQSRTERFGA